MERNVADVSAEHTVSALYMTPDLWFFASFIQRDELVDAVQDIIHCKQPLTSSYEKFGDFVYERYYDLIESEERFLVADYLMTIASLTLSRWQIKRALDAMVETALSIYFKSTNVADTAEYPRIIPHELENMRLNRPWQFNRDTFRKMLTAEPWLSWTERMRGQYRRNMVVISRVELARAMELFRDATDKVGSDLNSVKNRNKRRVEEDSEIKKAQKAIKRAVKLHDRVFGLDDVRKFMQGRPLLIEGKFYDYRVTMQYNSLFRQTIHRDTKMAPASLDIKNKQGSLLSSACLYFEDTSLLDYLLNVKLFASNAETEMDMLRSMHMTTATSAFYSDPMLPEIKGINDPVVGPLHTVESIFLHAGHRDRIGLRQVIYKPMMTQAKLAMAEVLNLPKFYRMWLAKLPRTSFWDYIDCEPDAIATLKSVGL